MFVQQRLMTNLVATYSDYTSFLYKDSFEFLHEAVYALLSVIQCLRQQILHRFFQR